MSINAGGSGSNRVEDWPQGTLPPARTADSSSVAVVLPEAEAMSAGPAPEPEAEEERSIKLGLGDFVFYSVLVSRAALFDPSTMAACFVAVVMGLGGTLFLLGVFRMALPALPISIFLGVSVYFATRFAITPMVETLSLS